jgi:hypothetical protein
LDVEQTSLEGGDSVAEEPIPEVDGDNSKELGDEAANKEDIINMIKGADVVVLEVEDDLGGRITISRNATAMHLLTSSLTGRCLRRLILIAWPS